MRTSLLLFVLLASTCSPLLLASRPLHTGIIESAQPYLLPNGRKDVCLDELTLKAKGECLQELLESYYGTYFTISCPSLSLALVHDECRGCPWDNVNASAVNPMLVKSLNRSELFHPADKSCSIANHVRRYRTYRNVRQQVYGLGIYGTLLLFFVSAYYSASPSQMHFDESGAMVFGLKLSEPLFLFTLWMLYNIGSIALIASEDYVEVCEAEADKMFQELIRITVYAALLIISLSRCRSLRTLDFDIDVQSWELYLQSGRRGHKKRLMCILIRFVGPCFLILAFVPVALRNEEGSPKYALSVCNAGAWNYSLFTIQVAIVLLEMFVVTVYAVGPSRNRYAFYLRYSMLTLSLFSCFMLIAFRNAGHFTNDIAFMMVPRVPDFKIGVPIVNLAHSICVSLLGMFEPLRTGWPRKLKLPEVLAYPE